MVINVRVNADHDREFHPLADHITKLRVMISTTRDLMGQMIALHYFYLSFNNHFSRCLS